MGIILIKLITNTSGVQSHFCPIKQRTAIGNHWQKYVILMNSTTTGKPEAFVLEPVFHKHLIRNTVFRVDPKK